MVENYSGDVAIATTTIYATRTISVMSPLSSNLPKMTVLVRCEFPRAVPVP